MTRWTPAACASQGTSSPPISEAQTLRVRQGELAVDDGPVTEQTLQIAGFNIFECRDRDEAAAVGSKNPAASFGVLELRAIAE